MKVLVIDCCVRKELSATAVLLKAYLEKYCRDCETEYVKLYEKELKPLLGEDIIYRDSLLLKGEYDNPFFDLARQFRDADRIVIAAPFWDMSFPSLLKVYLERVCASGITFGTSAEAGLQGLCHADKFVYLSTCGGFVKGENEGARYVRILGQRLLGINETEEFIIDGLDVDPSKRAQVLKDGIKRLLS
ncbi:MAG: NAD(P)H-dependent oxidoreductase [Sphaerochaetaceae bacterium]|nr:NAD(P)H-dependent oxidoreductase [Sphaerochaetaceae bacterium]